MLAVWCVKDKNLSLNNNFTRIYQNMFLLKISNKSNIVDKYGNRKIVKY